MLRRLLPWGVVVALVVVAVATAGWGEGPAGRSTPTPARPSPSASRTSSPTDLPTPVSVAEAQSVVRNAVLMRRDLPAGFERLPGRESYLFSAPSLRLCGRRFDSERFRLATHRVAFRAPSGHRDLGSVESTVVVYENGRAEQALAELEAAAPRCTSPVAPGPQEQPDTLALRVRSRGAGVEVRHDLVVERRGDVLSVLRVDGRQGYLTLDLARRLGNRLELLMP